MADYNTYPKIASASSKKTGTKKSSDPGKPKSGKQASMITLLKVDPKDSPEQKKIKEKHNETAATVFNNNRTGSSGIKNHVPYGNSNKTIGKNISVLTIDPESAKKADSVRAIMDSKYKRKKK